MVLHWSQLAQSSGLISACAIYTRNIGPIICCLGNQHRGSAFFSLTGLLLIISVMAIKHIVWMLQAWWCMRWRTQPVVSSFFNVILILGILRAIVWLWQEAFLLLVIWIIRHEAEGGCWLLDVEFSMESVVRYLRIIGDIILRYRWACWVVLVLTAQQAVNVVFFDVLREILLLRVRVADFPLNDSEWHNIDAPLLLETVKAVIFLQALAKVSQLWFEQVPPLLPRLGSLQCFDKILLVIQVFWHVQNSVACVIPFDGLILDAGNRTWGTWHCRVVDINASRLPRHVLPCDIEYLCIWRLVDQSESILSSPCNLLQGLVLKLWVHLWVEPEWIWLEWFTRFYYQWYFCTSLLTLLYQLIIYGGSASIALAWILRMVQEFLRWWSR